jgi:hypothetical protein
MLQRFGLIVFVVGWSLACCQATCGGELAVLQQSDESAVEEAADAAKRVGLVRKTELRNLPYAPTRHYLSRNVLGWTILVHRDLVRGNADEYRNTMTVLRQQLFAITQTIPGEALAQLRQVTIWLEKFEPHHPCACYHPDVQWLIDNQMNPKKARCVEIANAGTFCTWTLVQPWMVLHELAHAYHDQFLGGFENGTVKQAFTAAMDKRSYESVLYAKGRAQRHYACTNPMEYFAELTESYFGTNDFFPFVRSELRAHDLAGLRMIEETWGVKK